MQSTSRYGKQALGRGPELSLDEARAIENALLGAESALSLVETLAPTNWHGEAARVETAFERGEITLPDFEYRSSAERTRRSNQAHRVVHEVTRALSGNESLLARLLRDRAREIEVQAHLLRACGSNEARNWARQCHAFSPEELDIAARRAEEWLDLEAELAASDPVQVCLLSALDERARVRQVELGVDISVIARPLASLAASTWDGIYVAPDVRVSPAEAERIFVHEVEGHLLPRLRAKSAPPPFRIGTEDCAADDEGRAVLLEERSGLLRNERKRQLAVRFLLGRAAHAGRDELTHGAMALVRRGVKPSVVARAFLRAERGGGWGREIVYLPAYLRVKSALEAEPNLEEWMERGRISVRGARQLARACEVLPSRS